MGPAVRASLQRRWAPPLSPEPSLPWAAPPRATLSGGVQQLRTEVHSGSPHSKRDRPRRAGGPAQGLPGDDPRSRGARRTRYPGRPELWLWGSGVVFGFVYFKT